MILSIIAQDKTLITYRPKLNELTGSITATILLQQIMYWWDISGNKEFYKFKAPCKHPDYKEGDSWTESLGMTIYEFDSAYKKLKELGLVSSRNTIDRKTYYSLDENLLEACVSQIYLNGKNQDRKSEKTDILNGKNQDSITNIDYTETTTESEEKENTPDFENSKPQNEIKNLTQSLDNYCVKIGLNPNQELAWKIKRTINSKQNPQGFLDYLNNYRSNQDDFDDKKLKFIFYQDYWYNDFLAWEVENREYLKTIKDYIPQTEEDYLNNIKNLLNNPFLNKYTS